MRLFGSEFELLLGRGVIMEVVSESDGRKVLEVIGFERAQ